MKKLYLLGMVILLIPFSICAQSIERNVISNSGGSGTSANYQMAWTVGEPVIETYTQTNFILTQGFQQPNLLVTVINDTPEISCKVYPNPASNNLNIDVTNSDKNLTVTLTDMQGKALLTEQMQGLHQLDFQNYAIGTYILNVSDNKKKVLKKIQVQKINH